MSNNRKAPNLMPAGLLKPEPPPAPPPKRFAHGYRDVDNRDPGEIIAAHEARISALQGFPVSQAMLCTNCKVVFAQGRDRCPACFTNAPFLAVKDLIEASWGEEFR